MKIEVTYQKEIDGIGVYLEVIEEEDFYTMEIFGHDDEDYIYQEISKRGSESISFIEPNGESAIKKVERIIDVIRTQLESWRKLEMPDGKVYTI